MTDADGPATGKAPPELIAALARQLPPQVRQGPGVGLDAAVIEYQGRALVLTADPITFVDSGRAAELLIAVNANDIYALAADPRWLLATVLAPPAAAGSLAGLLAQLRAACAAAGITLVGGHTETTEAVNRTVISAALIGECPLSQIIYSSGAQPGDLIIQAGAAAVEGAAVLGHPELLDDPGLSIAPAARALRAVEGVHAMHDVTEGGIATAALELAQAAGLGIELDHDALLWLPQTLAVCRARGLDPLGLLGSGTLLAAVAPAAAPAALSALAAANVNAAPIGRVQAGIPATLIRGGQTRPLLPFVRDEALRALADATDVARPHAWNDRSSRQEST